MHADRPAPESRLARQNRRLRTALLAVGALVVGAAAMGFTELPNRSRRSLDPVGITTDGTHVYVLFKDGRIYRTDIQERERFNLCHPEFYHNNEKHNWNRFVEKW